MIFLIALGVILLFINFTIGCIYIAAILFALTIGLIIKEEKKKDNKEHKRTKKVKRTKRTKEVSMSNKIKELYEKDRKKFGAYLACAIIGFITVVACIAIIADGISKTSSCEHEYTIVEEIAPTYTEDGKVVKDCTLCGDRKTETLSKLTPPSYIEGVDYEEIYRAYKENELRANDTYQFNRYRITAEVKGIESSGLLNLTGGATLTMLIKIDNTYVYFLAEFEKDQEEALKAINVGDTITFEGECASDELWVECELIN